MGLLSDLPTRLRFTADAHESGMTGGFKCMRDAADEIERLRKIELATTAYVAMFDGGGPDLSTPERVDAMNRRLGEMRASLKPTG